MRRRLSLFQPLIKNTSPYLFHNNYLQSLEKTWLSKIPAETSQKNKKSVKVFFNQKYFPDSLGTDPDTSYSLSRLLTRTAAISVDGDKAGYFQNGEPFKEKDYFAKLQPGDPKGLSPQERLIASKKIITSNSSVMAVGGYPHTIPRQNLKKPFQIGLLSQVGAQFENSYLHYRAFIMDPYQDIIEHPHLKHLYEDTPTDFRSAAAVLAKYDSNGDLFRPRDGLLYIARNTSGHFYRTFFNKNAIIFNRKAFFNSLVEDIHLALIAVDQMAEKEKKPAFLKATGVGLGFFAKINCAYDIHGYLLPIYLHAYKHVLETYSFPHIKVIEFPIFGDEEENTYDLVFNGQSKINHIEVSHFARDVLSFTDKEREEYYVCAINPSDSNAFPGNEQGYGSVESALGNNTTIRTDQVYLTNTALLNPENQIGINLSEENSLTISRAP